MESAIQQAAETTTGLAGIFASAESLAGIALFACFFLALVSMLLVFLHGRMMRAFGKDVLTATELLADEIDESDEIHSRALTGILVELSAIKELLRSRGEDQPLG